MSFLQPTVHSWQGPAGETGHSLQGGVGVLQTSCELVGGELVKFYHTKKAGVKKLLAMLKKGMDTTSFRVF